MSVKAFQKDPNLQVDRNSFEEVDQLLRVLPLPPSSSLTPESTDVAESLRLITTAIKWAQKYGNSTHVGCIEQHLLELEDSYI